MRSHLPYRGLLTFALVACCLAGPGCSKGGDKVEGKYVSDNGALSVEFKADGKAQVSLGAGSAACDYQQDGDKVTVKLENQATVFTRNADGSLTNAEMGTFKKQG